MNLLIRKKSRFRPLGFVTPHGLIALLPCTAACSIVAGTLLGVFRFDAPSKVSQRTLTFAERVAYQRAIEDVYWRHRIWPKERPDPKPPLDAVMSQAQLEKKVSDYLRKSQALEDYWQRPISAQELQAEMDWMAQHTKQREVLRELFEALGSDPFVIAECLARPLVAERTLATVASIKKSRVAKPRIQMPIPIPAVSANYTLPVIANPSGDCIDDMWTATTITNAPHSRTSHTAVWTGSEMIIWGGVDPNSPEIYFDTGGKYNPSTDTWTATNLTNAPSARFAHTAVWTGSEMTIWGGEDDTTFFNTGGRYNPGTDTWAATSTTNAPFGRRLHTAVWTGSEMIVWGGQDENFFPLNTGGRYNPETDSWIATSTTNAPEPRVAHTAVWSSSEMIVWGGANSSASFVDTGGKYDPGTNSWTATSTTKAPEARASQTAVWTGSEMIVWGGENNSFVYLNSGGRYSPVTDSWIATSIGPSGRIQHTAVWTESEMIVWGGVNLSGFVDTGGRYSPDTDTWTATSTTNAPEARASHTAVWIGNEMIVWGGYSNSGQLNTGGRYCAQTASTPTPTPIATATPTATPTPIATPTSTPRPTPTPRPHPTPRARPTPAPRPVVR
jgi:N-acetylneuraminic acid mutarotase